MTRSRSACTKLPDGRLAVGSFRVAMLPFARREGRWEGRVGADVAAWIHDAEGQWAPSIGRRGVGIAQRWHGGDVNRARGHRELDLPTGRREAPAR